MSDGEVRCGWAKLQELEDMLRRLTLSVLKLPFGGKRGPFASGSRTPSHEASMLHLRKQVWVAASLSRRRISVTVNR
jgi:hypothetical protein